MDSKARGDCAPAGLAPGLPPAGGGPNPRSEQSLLESNLSLLLSAKLCLKDPKAAAIIIVLCWINLLMRE